MTILVWHISIFCLEYSRSFERPGGTDQSEFAYRTLMFRTMLELHEEEQAEMRGPQNEAYAPNPTHDDHDDDHSLRSVYYSAQGTISSRTSSINTLQFLKEHADEVDDDVDDDDKGVVNTGIVNTGVVDTGVVDTGVDDEFVNFEVALDPPVGALDNGQKNGEEPNSSAGSEGSLSSLKIIQSVPSLGELSLTESDPVFDKKQGHDEEEENTSVLIQAAGGVEASDSPLVFGCVQAEPRRLLSEAESLVMVEDERRIDGEGVNGQGVDGKEVDSIERQEQPNLIDELKRDLISHKVRVKELETVVKELETMVEGYQLKVVELEDQLGVQRDALERERQQRMHELQSQEKKRQELELCLEQAREEVRRLEEHRQCLEQGAQGASDNTEIDDEEAGAMETVEVEGEGRGTETHGECENHEDHVDTEGYDHEDDEEEHALAIEQLREENRYLKVVYTERISHLIAENGVLRDQLLEAEQELLAVDDTPRFLGTSAMKPAMNISVDVSAFCSNEMLRGTKDVTSSTDPLRRLQLHDHPPTSPSLDTATIGYSPLGAGRLMYSQFR